MSNTLLFELLVKVAEKSDWFDDEMIDELRGIVRAARRGVLTDKEMRGNAERLVIALAAISNYVVMIDRLVPVPDADDIANGFLNPRYWEELLDVAMSERTYVL